jgi:hypothetical protein
MLWKEKKNFNPENYINSTLNGAVTKRAAERWQKDPVLHQLTKQHNYYTFLIQFHLSVIKITFVFTAGSFYSESVRLYFNFTNTSINRVKKIRGHTCESFFLFVFLICELTYHFSLNQHMRKCFRTLNKVEKKRKCRNGLAVGTCAFRTVPKNLSPLALSAIPRE